MSLFYNMFGVDSDLFSIFPSLTLLRDFGELRVSECMAL